MPKKQKKEPKPKKIVKQSIADRAFSMLDLPMEVMQNLPKVTMVAGQRVVVENHRGLMDYDDNQITINGAKISVRILGDKLLIRAMNASEMLVVGTIFSVEFIR